MTDTWRDLIERARRGDRGAIDLLLARHVDALHAYVRLRMGPALRARETSVDLVQSVCREMLADLPRFVPARETGFRAWMLRRAEHKLGKRARFWKRACRDPGRERPLDSPSSSDREHGGVAERAAASPEENAIARERFERLEQAFAKLAPRDARVILLARVVGLPHAQVAEAMDLTESATWSLLHRALARLTTVLGDDAKDA